MPDGEEMESWEVLRQFLPEDWARQARELGALRRVRGVAGPAALLRTLLIHLANGYSLAETSARAREAGLAQMSSVAVFKRLRASEQWLRWLAEQTRQRQDWQVDSRKRRIRAVDATTVSEPGSTGTDWRMHYAFNVEDLQCDFFELTGVSGGETWRRVPVQGGDILLGDRAYATPVGVAHVVEAGGDVVVRCNVQSLPLYEQGKRFSLEARLRRLRVGQAQAWLASVRKPQGGWIEGRLLAVRRSAAATRAVRARLQRRASRKQHPVSPRRWRLAAYFLAWTTLRDPWSAAEVLELYRVRWQIELAFKRLKSIVGFGHLPKKDPASARAWLHGKLFVGLLAERLIAAANAFSPWGYSLADSEEPLARGRVHVP